MLHNKPPTASIQRLSFIGVLTAIIAFVAVVALLMTGSTSAGAQEDSTPPADSALLKELEANNGLLAEDEPFSLFSEPEVGVAEFRPAAPALISTAGWDLLEIPANDDGSSALVPLPFTINFLGNQYSALYVNNNGNVTFNEPMSTYTPFGLTGETGVPIIAPFFADIDTRGEGSQLVTYGASPDGNQFVVNWVDVGYFSSHSDKLISAQLVLTKRSGGTFEEGDFDITFNYGSIGWETGDASDGVEGFGGTPVRAGYSLGTGVEGTFFELAGSGQTRALTDGGDRALFTNSLNALSTPGRYTFAIRGDGSGQVAGNVIGTVTDNTGLPVSGAIVSIVAADGSWSSNTITGANGSYALSGLGTGDASVRVSPPAGMSLDAPAQMVTTAIGTPLTVDFVLSGPRTLPAGTTIDQGVPQTSGVPSVYWDSPFDITHLAAPGADVTFEIIQNGRILLAGDFTESATEPGLYTATITSLLAQQANSGLAQVVIYVNGVPIIFDLYIDPAGTVVDQDGQPIAGAEVTIYRSDNPDGPFEPVPDGSALLSPSNRTNPDVTDAQGRFSWDTVPGYYRVSASAPGYLAEDGSELAWTDVLPVPPEHLDLVLTLKSTDTTPTPEPEPGSSSDNYIFNVFASLMSLIGGLLSSIFSGILSLFGSSAS